MIINWFYGVLSFTFTLNDQFSSTDLYSVLYSNAYSGEKSPEWPGLNAEEYLLRCALCFFVLFFTAVHAI